MAEGSSHVIASLVRDAEKAAAKQVDPLAVLRLLLKLTLESEADPYLLIGMLTEGIAATVVQRIPDARQRAVGIEALILLHDRLNMKGLL